jgi:hypothetical protein
MLLSNTTPLSTSTFAFLTMFKAPPLKYGQQLCERRMKRAMKGRKLGPDLIVAAFGDVADEPCCGDLE